MYTRIVKHPTYQNDLEQVLENVSDIGKIFHKSFYIAGAAGLIGSYLVDVLLHANRIMNADITVYAAGRSKDRLRKRFEYCQDVHLHLLEQDVINPLVEMPDVDYIIHGASNAYPAAFRMYPVDTIMSNILGTQHLLEYAVTVRAERMLYISSGEVYGQGDMKAEGYEEDDYGYVDAMDVRSCYPNGKRTAETLCRAYMEERGTDIVVVRPCHTYGPNVTGADNRANVQFINSVLEDKDIVMHSKGENIRSYCYIADCAAAILTVLISGIAGNAYNIANKHAICTIAEYAKEVARQKSKNVLFEIPDEEKQKEQTKITKAVLNSAKLEQLGWQGRYDIERGIKHTLEILG